MQRNIIQRLIGVAQISLFPADSRYASHPIPSRPILA
jgi:hypothetical protein